MALCSLHLPEERSIALIRHGVGAITSPRDTTNEAAYTSDPHNHDDSTCRELHVIQLNSYEPTLLWLGPPVPLKPTRHIPKLQCYHVSRDRPEFNKNSRKGKSDRLPTKASPCTRIQARVVCPSTARSLSTAALLVARVVISPLM